MASKTNFAFGVIIASALVAACGPCDSAPEQCSGQARKTCAVDGTKGVADEEARGAESTGTVTSKDGTRIAYERAGQGPALILVDGAFSYRALNPTEAEVVGLLASYFTVYSYDRRGRGESGDTQPYAVQREIEDIDALIKLAGGAAYVCGGSSGAVLALEAAAHGLAITKLALYEPPFVVDDSRPPVPDDYQAQLERAAAEGRRGDAVEIFFTQAVRLPPEAVAPMRQSPRWPALEAVGHTLAYDAAIMGDTMRGQPLPRERWAGATMPTLIIDGGASPAYMHTGAEALARVLPDARRRTLEGQTHAVTAEAIAPVLIEFFAEGK